MKSKSSNKKDSILTGLSARSNFIDGDFIAWNLMAVLENHLSSWKKQTVTFSP
jgi:hypothetical protein